jgi:DNA-binding CsgD family transcriptional regulator
LSYFGGGVARLRESDYRAVLAFLSEAEALDGPDAFPAPIVNTLTKLIRCESATFCELDRPQRRLIAETLSTGEQLEDDPNDEGQQTFWRLVDRLPLCLYQQRSHRFDAVKLSDFVSQRTLRGLEIYADWYGRAGIVDELEVGIPSPPWHTKNLLFRRTTGDFDERDRLVGNLLQPHLSSMYRNALLRRRLTAAVSALETSREAVVFVDSGTRIEFATPRARRLLEAYFPEGPAGALPGIAIAWMGRQATRLNGDRGLPTASAPLVAERNGRRLVIQLVRAATADQNGVLMLDEQRAFDAKELGLTQREWEVLFLIARGKRNRDIAADLFISERTVRKHVENMFEKLGVRTRTAAVARAFPLEERLH